MEFGFLLHFAGCFVLPAVVGGNTNREHFLAACGGAHFGIAGDVSDNIGAVAGTENVLRAAWWSSLSGFGVEEDHFCGNNFRLAALLSALFVVPGIGLQTSCNKDLRSGAHKLSADISQSTPDSDSMEALAAQHFAGIGTERNGNDKIQIGHAGATGSLADSDGLCLITDELNAVEREHGSLGKSSGS